MRFPGRVLASLALAATILASLPSAAAANSVVNWRPCYGSATAECYAVITDGESRSGSVVSNNYSQVTSASAKVKVSCMTAPNNLAFVDNELWLVTPPNPSGPLYHGTGWQPEWLEAGITQGEVNGTYVGTAFFYAIRYWSSGYHYLEYVIPGVVSMNTDYTFTIRWNSVGYWEVVLNGVIKARISNDNQAPGSHQAVQAGAEMLYAWGEIAGDVSALQYTMAGITYVYFGGPVDTDTRVFNLTANTNMHLGFATKTHC